LQIIPCLLLCILLSCNGGNHPKPPLRVAIVYYTPIHKSLEEELVKTIRATYRCTIKILPGVQPLPANAYYKPRNRYRAEILLKELQGTPGYDKLMAITAKDISTTHKQYADWGVMGLAFRGRKPCVISTYRVRTTNTNLFNERVIKLALHELGHTMGLPHCSYSASCFMADASGTIKTVDRGTRRLCEHCKTLIQPFITKI
jgi:archaemetzincin